MRNLYFDDGEPLIFKIADAKTFRGARLRGANLFQSISRGGTFSIHEFITSTFDLALASIHFPDKQQLHFPDEGHLLRFETVLTGELSISTNNAQILVLPGQYHIAAGHAYTQVIKPETGCQLLTIYLKPELLAQVPMGDKIANFEPRTLPSPMREVVAAMLEHAYGDELTRGFYDTCVRKLLFYHLALPRFTPPGKLPEKVIAAVNAADAVIRQTLQHYTIPELSKMVHLNQYELKMGFSRLFGMGSFKRLIHHRLEHAKWRLVHTTDPVGDIAQSTGYANTPAFINAFRKKFGTSPLVWRNQQRGKT